MARIPLSLGSYTDRSIIANCQRCLNLFPRENPKDYPVPYTFYPTPGTIGLSTPPTAGRGRGLYRATNNILYSVVGSSLYKVGSDWSYKLLGTLTSGATTPVSMADNGTTMMLVDGSAKGYTIGLYTDSFAPISSPAFYGADRVDCVDAFFVLNKPATGQFYCTLANSTTFDPLYYATKIGFADKLASIIVSHREIWLIGESTTEVWVNSGAADFPFQIMTGSFIEHGCAAKYSIAKMGDAVFWLSRDLQGQCVVVKGQGYQAARISTHAIETAIAKYKMIDDAVAFTYQQEGHQFYVLSFPSADATWVYDQTSGLWHERCFLDSNGVERRHRGNSSAFAYGKNVTVDWQNGALYALDLDTYTDVGNPIIRRRGFPHLGNGGNRVFYSQFLADMEVGTATGTTTAAAIQALWTEADFSNVILGDSVTDLLLDGVAQDTYLMTDGGVSVVLADDIDEFLIAFDLADAGPPAPQVWLRWSDTRGATWSNPIAADLGGGGEYLRSVQFQRLGMARDRVFELFWSYPAKTALNGAFISMTTGKS